MYNVSFILKLFNDETPWIKVAVEAAIGGGELQHAVVRVAHTAGVVLLIALVPDHFFEAASVSTSIIPLSIMPLNPLASQK